MAEEGALFVKSNVRNFLSSDSYDGVRLSDYVPQGNTLFVSANYLDAQGLDLSSDYLTQMKNLKTGEFGLILPDHVANKRDSLVATYEHYMSSFAATSLDGGGQTAYTARAYTQTVASGQRRFIYNTDANSSLHYLSDPIMVVTSPDAMGDGPVSRLFWGAEAAASLHLKGYDTTIALLEEEGLYQRVSYLIQDLTAYECNLSSSYERLMMLGLGVLLGLVTSALLYDTMALLYFEQFRRDIFIKRLAGQPFTEIHYPYLLAQVLLYGLALASVILLTRHVGLSFLVLALFVDNMVLILLRQSRLENRSAVLILKGK